MPELETLSVPVTDVSEPRSTDVPEGSSDRPREPAGTRRLDNRAWLAERVDGRLCAVMGIAWYVLFAVGQALEPAPRDPHAVPAWIEGAVSAVFLAAIVAMIPGLVARRRWGLLASLGAAVVYVAATVACPTTGHHAFGLWWLGEMACAVALVGLSVVTLRRS